ECGAASWAPRPRDADAGHYSAAARADYSDLTNAGAQSRRAICADLPCDGPRARRRQMRILVVEDNGELVALLAKALTRAGLDVDSARNAADAEASLRAVHYAAVVLDLGLPDADGLVVLDQMRRRRDPTPVLILSARGGLDDRVSGLAKGASDYLVKPFAMEELLARLQA